MTEKELEDKIVSIVAEKADFPKDQIQRESSFRQDLSLDSLAILDLIMAIEEAFEITIPDEEAEKVKTVDDAIKYLHASLTQ